MAVELNDPIDGASEVRTLEERFRDLERLLGRKTMDILDGRTINVPETSQGA